MSLTPQIADALTIAEVQLLADGKTFARGKAYFHEGAVSRLEQDETTVRAYVQGTHRYIVELGVGAVGDLTYECNCPVGDDGIFCKHTVAVALSWLENSGEEVFHIDEGAPVSTRKKRKTQEQLIHEHVSTLPEATLRELILEAAERDKTLRDKLLFAARTVNTSDLPSMKTAVRQATSISRPLNWREAGAYGDGLLSLAATLHQRLDGPHAAQVVELAELAIAGAEKSLEQIDDSGGDVMPAIQELMTLHQEACTRTRPDPIKLADRLFRYQTEGVWDTFYNVLPAYAAPLGEVGIARYRELAQNEWNKLPALAIDPDHRRSFDSGRMRVEQAMTSLAELDGDVDALIRIQSKDLSSPYRFLRVAELCAKHARYDEGLTWAKAGLDAPGKRPDPGLLDFCIKEYVRRREFAHADEHAWQRFEQHPTAAGYKALMLVAKDTGTRDLTRERAVEHLWALVKKEESTTKERRSVWQTSTRTELVMLFLAERENENAWNAFKGGPVRTDVWGTMAAIRGKTHPQEAIALYHRLLPIAAENGTRGARYDEAFAVVRAIRHLRAELNDEGTFADELASIRQTYRAKRNFIKLLETLG